MLRRATPADAAAIHAIYAPIVERTAISFELEAPSVDDIAARIANHSPLHAWLVDEDDATRALRGYAYASPYRARAAYRFTVELSVYVAPEARRSGVARTLYRSLVELSRRQGYVRALAAIALPNAASVALHEAVGFTAIGVLRDVGYKLGAWHDVGMFELPLRASAHPEHEPLPVDAVLSA